jgi:hypothetical protein
MDKVLEEPIHLLLILDHEVNISVAQLESQALPAVKWQLTELLHFHQVEVLSQHPEST